MCEYCKNIDTGDDYNPIISLNEYFGFFGIVDIDVYLQKNPTHKYPQMVLGLCENDGKGNDICIKKIKYCPICGRDLESK